MKHLKLMILMASFGVFNSVFSMDAWSELNKMDTAQYEDPSYSNERFYEDENPNSSAPDEVEIDLSFKEVADELAACAQARAINAKVRARALAALSR